MKALSHFRTFGVICPLITRTPLSKKPLPPPIQGEKDNDPPLI